MSIRTKIMLIVFAGIHIPLIAAVAAVSLLHVTAVQALLIRGDLTHDEAVQCYRILHRHAQ